MMRNGGSPALRLIALAGVLNLAAAGIASPASEPGEVLWWDLLTEDAAEATEFYSDLLGWDVERGPRGHYVARVGGVPIAAISEIADALPGVSESTWLVGLSVPDIEIATAAARRLGGRPHRDGRVEGFARWAALEDPQGAPVILMVPELELGQASGPGAWVWAELWSRDPEASVEFYTTVVGYEHSTVDRPRGDYPVFRSGGKPRAGLVEIQSDTIETAWAPYAGVADLAATLARTVELGGRVLMEPRADVVEGRVALLSDPTGGAFFVYELEEAAE